MDKKKKKRNRIKNIILSCIMIICVLFNVIFYAYVKPKCVYAFVPALAVGAMEAAGAYVSSETALGLLVAGMAAYGITDVVSTREELDAMSQEEQKYYYDSIAVSDRELLKNLLDNGYFADTGIEDLVSSAVNGTDGTSALENYLNSTGDTDSKKVTPYVNPKGPSNGDGKISASIAVTCGFIGMFGEKILAAMQKAIDATKSETVVLPNELPDPGESGYQNYIIYQSNDDKSIICLRLRISKDYITVGSTSWSVSKNWWQIQHSGAYVYKLIDGEWVSQGYERTGSSGYGYHDADYVDSGNLNILYNSLPVKNGSLLWCNTNLFLGNETGESTEDDNESDLNKLLKQYNKIYVNGYNDALNAKGESNKIIIHDNPEVIIKEITTPAAQPVVNPDTGTEPDINSSVNNYINNIYNYNNNALDDLAPDDQENFKDENPEYNLPDYKTEIDGIEDVFPFCIPFDIYRCIKVLCADAEAPRWEFPFVIKSLGINESIVLDMSKYESVAKICRWVETLIFIYGLAAKTKAFMFT